MNWGVWIVIFICLVLSIAFYHLPTPSVQDIGIDKNILKQDIINSCSNLSLYLTTECLVDNVKLVFKYNKTDDNKSLTYEELIENGGDCRNWAFFYEEVGRELGFRATTTRIVMEEGVRAHRFAILLTNKSYCVIDQRHYQCFL